MQSFGNEAASSAASGFGGGGKGIDWASLLKTLSPALGGLLGQGLGMANDKWVNPADQASKTLGQIPGAAKNAYDPYINAGMGALPQLQDQYKSLLGDPGSALNKIGQGYQQSPGFDFQVKQALKAAGNAAAAGGMAGSPQHQYQNEEVATGLANQDYNNWLSKALGLYGQGLSGQQDLYKTGYGASSNMAQSVQDALAKQAELQYKGQDAANQHQATGGSFWNSLGNFAGAALPFFL